MSPYVPLLLRYIHAEYEEVLVDCHSVILRTMMACIPGIFFSFFFFRNFSTLFFIDLLCCSNQMNLGERRVLLAKGVCSMPYHVIMIVSTTCVCFRFGFVFLWRVVRALFVRLPIPIPFNAIKPNPSRDPCKPLQQAFLFGHSLPPANILLLVHVLRCVRIRFDVVSIHVSTCDEIICISWFFFDNIQVSLPKNVEASLPGTSSVYLVYSTGCVRVFVRGYTTPARRGVAYVAQPAVRSSSRPATQRREGLRSYPQVWLSSVFLLCFWALCT